MNNDEIKLSVCTVTYNQKDYIAQALDSFLMQKTNFKFQVIVGDDCSTDGTTEILKEYAEKYPDIIKPIFRKKNIGPARNSLDVYDNAKTPYVAICDGDDYWTDENKLQKQVDFLETHPNYSVCFHSTKIKSVFNDDTIVYPNSELRNNRTTFTINDIIQKNIIHPNSLVYRWRFSGEDIKLHYSPDICPGDVFLILLHAEIGLIGFIDMPMSVYRMGVGMSAPLALNNDISQVYNKFPWEHLNYFEALKKEFNYKFETLIRNNKINISKQVLKAFVDNNNNTAIHKMQQEYPEYYWLAKTFFDRKVREEYVENEQLLKNIRKNYKRMNFLGVFIILNFILSLYCLMA